MHVANATDSSIWVKCDSERAYVLSSKFDVKVAKGDGVSAECKLDWNKIRTGFTRIQPGQYLNFDLDEDGKKIVYISIFLESEGKFIADALPRKMDKSIIITRRGEIKNALDGSIWVDETGLNHGPNESRELIRQMWQNIVRPKNMDKK